MASGTNFGEVRALVIEQSFTRTVLRRALYDLSLRDIVEATHCPEAGEGHPALIGCDLLIANVTDDDQKAIRLVSDIRRRLIPCNPFMGIVLTSGSSSAPVVRGAVDAGVDSILLKPYAMQQVMDHVMALVDRRAPFVVTADYIGPDRRGQTRQVGSAQTPTFEVPNSLRDKVRGGTTASAAAIDDAWARIDHERTNRLIFQILFLIRLMPIAFADPSLAPARRELSRLPALVKSTIARLITNEQQELAAQLGAWPSSYLKLAEESARAASRAQAERITVQLMLLDAQDTEEAIIARADEAVGNYITRLRQTELALAAS